MVCFEIGICRYGIGFEISSLAPLVPRGKEDVILALTAAYFSESAEIAAELFRSGSEDGFSLAAPSRGIIIADKGAVVGVLVAAASGICDYPLPHIVIGVGLYFGLYLVSEEKSAKTVDEPSPARVQWFISELLRR